MNTATATATALRQLKDLPSPPAGLFGGNLMQIKPKQVHRIFEGWARDLGPEFVVWFGKIPSLVLTDHELISKILRERPDDFARTRRVSELGREMGLTPGLFSAEGESWRVQRRMVMSAFSPNQIRAYFPSMLRVTERMQRRWQRAASQGTRIDLLDDLMRYTVDTITGLAFGNDVNTIESDDDIIQQHLNTVFPAMARRAFSVVPYWRWFKLPADRQLDRSIVEINKAIDGFIAQARQRLAQDPARREAPPNLLEAFIVSAEQEGGKISDLEIRGNVLTMLLAGEDTTANSMAWMLSLLKSHPEQLARLQREVREAFPPGQAPTMDVLNRLEFMDACIHETMRLKPVAPFLAVQALREVSINQIRVPRDTIVWTLFRHDATSERYFEQAERFEPQRWMSPGDEADKGGVRPNAKGIAMPFGSGPRICPGRYLALLEIKLCMVMLMRDFDILSVLTDSGGEAGERMSFTMVPDALYMTLASRTPSA